jgi:glycosyltransferase involved in cell wall biosynthesis
MRIAVIIPTYDRPSLLRRALASVHAQTRTPNKIIMVNDGTMHIPNDLLGDKVQIVCTLGLQGVSVARNVGAASCQADRLAFLDDDDTWEPDYLQACEHLSHVHNAQLVLTAFNKVRENGGSTPEKVPPERLGSNDWLVRNQGLRGSNLFIDRLTYLQVGGFDPSLPSMNDLDLAIRLAEVERLRYVCNTEHLVNFHVHSGPRLTTPGSSTNRNGVMAFLAKHGHRMNVEQRKNYRERVKDLWGWDIGAYQFDTLGSH